jgi:streptogramin lyase
MTSDVPEVAMQHARPLLVSLGALGLLTATGCANGLPPSADAPDTSEVGSGSFDGGSTASTSDAGGDPAAERDAGISSPKTPALEPGQFNPTPQTSDGVKQDPRGFVVLDSGEVRLGFAWLANVGAGTVSKIDTKTGKEVARYYSVFPIDGMGKPTGLLPAAPNSPSRTAVDQNGDLWVANRAPSTLGSVTKIANFIGDCVDRNQDGKIQTSRDLNANGIIDTTAGSGELIQPVDPADPKQYDECVLFSTPLGTPGKPVFPRALAIDAGGDEGRVGSIWVGLFNGIPETGFSTGAFVKLSGKTGQMLPITGSGSMAVAVSPRPYGAAVDGKGRLFFTLGGQVGSLDVRTGVTSGPHGPPAGVKSCSGYGMTVDHKNRVWMAGIGCDASAARVDPDNGFAYTVFDLAKSGLTEAFGRGRGIATDDKGIVWMSSYLDKSVSVGRLVAFDAETGALKTFKTPGAVKQVVDFTSPTVNNGIGVGLDDNNRVWVACGSGVAVGVDRDTGAILASPRVPSLYTYSDFTGYTLRHFTAPRGSYRAVFEACPGSSATPTWVEATFEADVPANTKLQLFAKAAARRELLRDAGTKRIGPFETSPASLSGLPREKFLELEVVLLSTDKASTPALKRLNATFACQGGLK